MTDVMRMQLNRIAQVLPFVCSAAALALVLANIIAGMPPQPDENASAHAYQLLIVGQLPIIALFAATADWGRGRRLALVLLLQALAIMVALLPVWLAGY